MTAILAVLGWFWNSSAGRAILIAVGGAVCLALAFKVHEIRVERRVTAEIERKAREQADAAAHGASRVGDCYSVGGKWLQHEGRCVVSRVPSSGP